MVLRVFWLALENTDAWSRCALVMPIASPTLPFVKSWWLALGIALLPLMVAMGPSSGAAADCTATAGGSRVSIAFDASMRRRLTWQNEGAASIVAADPGVQPGIRIDGRELVAFTLDAGRTRQTRLAHPEFGPGLEIVAEGASSRGPLSIAREAWVFLPDRQPDVAVFQTRYRNDGGIRVHVDRVDAEKLLLDRSQAEPKEPPHAFASYQGAAYAWGKDYALIRLKPGFAQKNFLGQDDDLEGPEGVGGGMPLVDVWGRTMGVAVAHVETGPRWVSLPVAVRPDGRVEVGLTEEPKAKFGQREWLAPGEIYETVTSAVIFHRGDSHDALANYGDLLRARGVAIPKESPKSAHEPYWKSWGWRKDVTVDKFLGILPELAEMGIRTANLDDGWFDFMGDWQPNRAPGKFPAGDADMKRFVERVHGAGFRTAIWWYPLGVDAASRLARERRDLLVMDAAGKVPKDIDGYHQLCPGHAPARAYIRSTLVRFVKDWRFDGVYLDFQGLSAVPACYNPAHEHRTPLDGFESVPKVFAEINEELHRHVADPFLEACVCALPHAPWIMPHYPLANASDPRSSAQARRRVKAEKAIRGPLFAVGDGYQVPFDEHRGTSLKESFETAIGTGAQLTTFYADLDPRQKTLWRRWFQEYRAQGLGTGETLNLYDIAFDLPEAHVVRRGRDLYYGFYAATWTVGQRIELRGLEPGVRYEVIDYGRGRSLGTVSSETPHLAVDFEEHLLVRARPLPPPATPVPASPSVSR